MGGGVTPGGYVKVQGTPYAYDQGGETEPEDPNSAPLPWFCHPQIWGIAKSGSIGRRIFHLFFWISKDNRPSKAKSLGLSTGTRASSYLCECILCITYSVRDGVIILEMVGPIPVICLSPA